MLDVAVIGCGVIGLTTALATQETLTPHATVTIFTAQRTPETTGDVSAGLWTPYLLQNTPQDKVINWAKATQDHVLELWKRGEAKAAGISLQLITVLSDDKNFRRPEWIKISLGHSEIPPEQIERYNQRYRRKFTAGFAYMAFTWEPTKFLPYLERRFIAKGGRIVVQKIQRFEELSGFDVVVNCAGLGARVLAADASVRPIRGQVTRVYAPWQFHTIMIDSDDSSYVIANQKCVVLGGTHQEDDYRTSVDVDDKNAILARCFGLAPALKTAPVLQDSAGLRPGRDQVRLEIEHLRADDEKIMKVVHNYGHGGSGVTLSIGCALEAATLVKEALKLGGHCKL